MKCVNVETCGANVFWSLQDSKLEDLRDGFDRLGLAEHCPKVRDDLSALEAAIWKEYGRKDREIVRRKNPRENGVELVDIERGENGGKNYYTLNFAAKVVDGAVKISDGWAAAYKLQELYEAFKRVVPAASVSGKLVKLIENRLFGHSLRESGGIYWIHDDYVDQYEKIAEVIEDAAVDSQKPSKMYRQTLVLNESTLRSVRDTMLGELVSSARAIEEEVLDTSISREACDNRVEKANEIYQRAAKFSEILGEGVAAVAGAVEQAKKAAVLAAFSDVLT